VILDETLDRIKAEVFAATAGPRPPTDPADGPPQDAGPTAPGAGGGQDAGGDPGQGGGPATGGSSTGAS